MKILIAVENIAYGEQIAGFVMAQEWQTTPEIKIMHVVEPIQEGFYCDPLPEEKRWLRSKQLVDEMAAKLRSRYPGVDSIVIGGQPAEEILRTAKNWKSDLLILGSHGRKGVAKWLLGSVSTPALQQAPCSVLVIKLPDRRHQYNEEENLDALVFTPNQQTEKATCRILITLKDRRSAEAIENFVAELGCPANTKLRLLHAIEPSTAIAAWPNDQYRKNADELLKTTCQRLVSRFREVQIETAVVEGFPKDEILSEAIRWQATVIIMGSKSRCDFGSFLLGNVSTAIVDSAPCAVMVVKDKVATSGQNRPSKDQPIHMKGQASNF